jgi:hypothetical protein
MTITFGYECEDRGTTFYFPGTEWGYANRSTLAVQARRKIRISERCPQRHKVEREIEVVILKVKATGFASARTLAHAPAELLVGTVRAGRRPRDR